MGRFLDFFLRGNDAGRTRRPASLAWPSHGRRAHAGTGRRPSTRTRATPSKWPGCMASHAQGTSKAAFHTHQHMAGLAALLLRAAQNPKLVRGLGRRRQRAASPRLSLHAHQFCCHACCLLLTWPCCALHTRDPPPRPHTSTRSTRRTRTRAHAPSARRRSSHPPPVLYRAGTKGLSSAGLRPRRTNRLT